MISDGYKNFNRFWNDLKRLSPAGAIALLKGMRMPSQWTPSAPYIDEMLLEGSLSQFYGPKISELSSVKSQKSEDRKSELVEKLQNLACLVLLGTKWLKQRNIPEINARVVSHLLLARPEFDDQEARETLTRLAQAALGHLRYERRHPGMYYSYSEWREQLVNQEITPEVCANAIFNNALDGQRCDRLRPYWDGARIALTHACIMLSDQLGRGGKPIEPDDDFYRIIQRCISHGATDRIGSDVINYLYYCASLPEGQAEIDRVIADLKSRSGFDCESCPANTT